MNVKLVFPISGLFDVVFVTLLDSKLLVASVSLMVPRELWPFR